MILNFNMLPLHASAELVPIPSSHKKNPPWGKKNPFLSGLTETAGLLMPKSVETPYEQIKRSGFIGSSPGANPEGF
jgi:hypothetical protein